MDGFVGVCGGKWIGRSEYVGGERERERGIKINTVPYLSYKILNDVNQ